MYANKVNNRLNGARPLEAVLRVLPLRRLSARRGRVFSDPAEAAAFDRSSAAGRALVDMVARRWSG